MLIKNQTPYLGKIKLKFEKSPWYSSGNNKLNKIHLNLGFTKLVSRIYVSRGLNGFIPDPKKVELINQYTGGKIGEHKFNNNEYIYNNDEYILENSFLAPDGTYLGDLSDGWRYYKNQMIVTQKKPNGVAILLQKNFFNILAERNGIVEDYFSSFVKGYYGYSHRGGNTFRLGDRLFDPDYVPVESDYIKEEWDKYKKLANKAEIRNRKEGWLKDGDAFEIASIVPFNRRGKITIQTWEQAEQAAINMSNYLS
jgi:hypothetical protein